MIDKQSVFGKYFIFQLTKPAFFKFEFKIGVQLSFSLFDRMVSTTNPK